MFRKSPPAPRKDKLSRPGGATAKQRRAVLQPKVVTVGSRLTRPQSFGPIFSDVKRCTLVVIEIESATLRRLYADWDARRRGRKLPARADFDPLELKYILGNLS